MTSNSASMKGSFPGDERAGSQKSPKAPEAVTSIPGQRNMATIADDDDRLLVRIGYTPVGSSA